MKNGQVDNVASPATGGLEDGQGWCVTVNIANIASRGGAVGSVHISWQQQQQHQQQ